MQLQPYSRNCIFDHQALHDPAERKSGHQPQLILPTVCLSSPGQLVDAHMHNGMPEFHPHTEGSLPADEHINIPLPSSEHGFSHEDHLLVHHLFGGQPEPTIPDFSARILLPASSSELSMMGWRSFCSPPRPTAAAIVPSKVCALRRQIFTTGSMSKEESPVHDCIHKFHCDGVCLELNIGRGGGLHVGSGKSLQDIHSEERSGFSKWKRPEQKESCGSGITQSTSNITAERSPSPEKAEVDNIAAIHAVPASPLSLHLGNGLTTAAEDQINPPDLSACSNAGSHLIQASSPFHSVAGCSALTMPWASTPSIGEAICHRGLSTGKLLQAAFSTELSPAKRQKLINHEHPRPISSKAISILDESFYHHQVLSPVSRQIINNSSSNDTDRNRSHNGINNFLAKINGDHSLSFQSLSTHRTLKAIEVPSVQERCLVEFLHAKKQQRDHFLDKVIVKEDVYQSHPWNFAGAVGGGSLYFCCSTKYTKRGNMTRNRMTREGGRWKQQGMVQPIFMRGGDMVEAAHKTYLSYIPRGGTLKSATQLPLRTESMTDASFFLHHNPTGFGVTSSATTGSTPLRVKHRHRMIEIALQEDLVLEKHSFKLKVAPNPFLVVCVLRNTV